MVKIKAIYKKEKSGHKKETQLHRKLGPRGVTPHLGLIDIQYTERVRYVNRTLLNILDSGAKIHAPRCGEERFWRESWPCEATFIPSKDRRGVWDPSIRCGFKAFLEDRARLLVLAFEQRADTRLFERD